MLTREKSAFLRMENYSKFIRGESGEAKDEMQNYGSEERLVGKDNDSSPDDPKERAVLEEHLYWARMERQKFLALSAEADETIWNLATLARRTMQERDEATNQARMILASFQMMKQGQHARTGTGGYCIASSSNFGHLNLASSMDAYFHLPPLRSFASLVQEPFDPDMFLVDAVKSPQDAVPAAAGSSGLEKNSGAYEHSARPAEGTALERKISSASGC